MATAPSIRTIVTSSPDLIAPESVLAVQVSFLSLMVPAASEICEVEIAFNPIRALIPVSDGGVLRKMYLERTGLSRRVITVARAKMIHCAGTLAPNRYEIPATNAPIANDAKTKLRLRTSRTAHVPAMANQVQACMATSLPS